MGGVVVDVVVAGTVVVVVGMVVVVDVVVAGTVVVVVVVVVAGTVVVVTGDMERTVTVARFDSPKPSVTR